MREQGHRYIEIYKYPGLFFIGFVAPLHLWCRKSLSKPVFIGFPFEIFKPFMNVLQGTLILEARQIPTPLQQL